jgi:hypothetical protein
MTDRSNLHRILPTIVSAIAGLVVLGIGLFFMYSLFWPAHFLDIYSINVVSPQKAGATTLDYTVRFCKRTDNAATVGVTVRGVQGTHVSLVVPAYSGTSPATCGTVTIPLAIAPLPPGHFQLYESVSYSVNALRHVTINAHSNVFTVVK